MSIDLAREGHVAVITLEPAGAAERARRPALLGSGQRLGGGARRSFDPRSDPDRGGGALVQRRGRSEELHPGGSRARRAVADPARATAQPRPRGLDSGNRGGQRLLPRRRHDAAARDRPSRRRRARPRSGCRRSSGDSSRPTAGPSGRSINCPSSSAWRCCSPAIPWTLGGPSSSDWSIASSRPNSCSTTAMDYGERIAANAPLAVRAIKELAYRSRDLDLAGGLRLEQVMARIVRQQQRCPRGCARVRREAPAGLRRHLGSFEFFRTSARLLDASRPHSHNRRWAHRSTW